MSNGSHTTARPATWGGTSRETTWFGTRSASWSNHHSDIRVRIRPLSGMVAPSTKSKIERRSLATMSRRPACTPSVIRYRSRTLPECSGSVPSIGGAGGMFGSPMRRPYRRSVDRRRCPAVGDQLVARGVLEGLRRLVDPLVRRLGDPPHAVGLAPVVIVVVAGAADQHLEVRRDDGVLEPPGRGGLVAVDVD